MQQTLESRADDRPLPNEVSCVVQPQRPEDVNEAAYLAANPDAARSGKTARAHFQAAGQAERRLQWANQETVARMRAHKLARIRWRAPSVSGQAPGETRNFLTPETLAAFGIPEDVPVSAHSYTPPVTGLIEANRDKLFLDVGAGLRHTYYVNVVNTDIYRSICTDVMCVGEHLPFADEQFDFVFCFAVLEHTMRPWDVAREMCRVLKPGGTVLVDWPFLQPMHGYPYHYFNATPVGNESLFRPYCDVISVEVQWHHHPAIAAQWMLTAWRNGLPPQVAKTFQGMTVGALIEQPIEAQLNQEYCQALHPELRKAIASGSLVTAVKRAVSIQSSRPEGRSAFGKADRAESSLATGAGQHVALPLVADNGLHASAGPNMEKAVLERRDGRDSTVRVEARSKRGGKFRTGIVQQECLDSSEA